MKTSAYLGILAAVLVGVCTVASGCDSDDDKASSSADAGILSDTGPASDAAPACVEAPNCAHCSVGLSLGNGACLGRSSCCANAAENNGKASVQLANEVQQCVCQESCREQCAGSCNALSAVTPDCLACSQAHCLPQLIACLSDVDTDPNCVTTDAGVDAGNDAGDGGDEDGGDAGDGGDGGE